MRDDLRLAPDRGMGAALLAGMAGLALVAALIVWAYGTGSRVAHKSARTTIGLSTGQPAAPTTAPSPAPQVFHRAQRFRMSAPPGCRRLGRPLQYSLTGNFFPIEQNRQLRRARWRGLFLALFFAGRFQAVAIAAVSSGSFTAIAWKI